LRRSQRPSFLIVAVPSNPTEKWDPFNVLNKNASEYDVEFEYKKENAFLKVGEEKKVDVEVLVKMFV
jgi:hypothetical protein